MPYIIRIKRKQLGLTQAQLAQKVGCSQKHISQLELDTRGSSPDLARKVAEILNLSFEDTIQADREAGESNREARHRRREQQKINRSLRTVIYPSAPRQAYAQRRLIIRCGRVVQVFSE